MKQAIKCRFCNEFLEDQQSSQVTPGHVDLTPPVPTAVRFDKSMDSFVGTMPLVVKLAMQAVQKLGWTIDQVNEAVGLVTFQTGISWGSWSGITGSLDICEVSPHVFQVSGTGKQNIRGAQAFAINLGGEAQSKSKKVIQMMKQLASP